MKTLHTFVLAAKSNGQLRVATFQDREHIVVPVVMMVEGVVHAVNSPHPDLVLREEFSKNFKGWNGRPVVGGHPYLHGEPISANDPTTLEANAFGSVFNTDVKGDRLVAELWIDPVRAAKPGSIGERALERIKSGDEILEVSVGVFASTEKKPGVFKGKNYEGIWRDYVPDHLAVLAEGDIGACSVEMGCGAMRAATVHLVTAGGIQALHQEVEVSNTSKSQSIKERFKSFLASLTAELNTAADVGDSDVRSALNRKLREVEPGFLGVEEVFSATNKVVYATMPSDKFTLVRRSFTVDGADVSIGDDPEEVQFVQSFEPIAATEHATVKAACGCSGHVDSNNAVSTASGEALMTKSDRINALIASKKLGPALTATVLEAFTDEQLTAVEKAAADAPEPAAVVPAAQPVAAAAAPAIVAAASEQTTEQFINAAPAEVQEGLREAVRVTKERRTMLVSRLKASGRSDYTDAELNALTIHGLERLAKLAGVQMIAASDVPVDFSALGMPRQENSNTIDAAPSLTERLVANAKK